MPFRQRRVDPLPPRSRRGRAAAAVTGLLIVAALTSCSGTAASNPSGPSAAPATEVNPAGDIPDNQVFVPYSDAAGGFSVRVPEGWAQSSSPAATRFADKLNSVEVSSLSIATAPTVASIHADEVPALKAGSGHVAEVTVSMVTRAAGPAALITYTADAAPDPVTGKVVRDAVERYEFWRAGAEAVLVLAGPVGADNIDPWRVVSDSLAWLP